MDGRNCHFCPFPLLMGTHQWEGRYKDTTKWHFIRPVFFFKQIVWRTLRKIKKFWNIRHPVGDEKLSWKKTCVDHYPYFHDAAIHQHKEMNMIRRKRIIGRWKYENLDRLHKSKSTDAVADGGLSRIMSEGKYIPKWYCIRIAHISIWFYV